MSALKNRGAFLIYGIAIGITGSWADHGGPMLAGVAAVALSAVAAWVAVVVDREAE